MNDKSGDAFRDNIEYFETPSVIGVYNSVMTRSLLILVLCAVSALGQTLPTQFQPFAQIKDYLQLTDSQYQTLLSNNTQYADWYNGKQDRIQWLQREIAQETARDKPDPMGIGVRYVEVETICRDIGQQAAVTSKMNTDMLTVQQKAKLKTLEDAMKLAPVISDAQSAKLISGSASVGGFFFDSVTGNGFSSVLLSVPRSTYGCLPQVVSRTGDFSQGR